jgi:serine/threonine-protein kinase
VAPLAIAERHVREPETLAQGLAWPLFFLLLLGILARVTRKTIMKTAINRRLLGAIVILLVAQLALAGGMHLLGLSPTYAVVLQFLLWAVVTGLISLTVDRRLTPMAVGYFAAFVAAAAWPAERYYVMSAANLVLTLNVVAIWGRREPPAAAADGRD